MPSRRFYNTERIVYTCTRRGLFSCGFMFAKYLFVPRIKMVLPKLYVVCWQYFLYLRWLFVEDAGQQSCSKFKSGLY